MLSVIVLANKDISNLESRNTEIVEQLQSLKINYGITYITNSNYSHLNDIKKIVAQNEKHFLIVLSENTNRLSQLYVGLDTTSVSDNALVIDADTNLELIKQMLEKHKEGFENIYVKKKENAAFSFFETIGKAIYSVGVKMLKKPADMCRDSEVMLLNRNAVNAIVSTPQAAKQLLISNLLTNGKTQTVALPTIHDAPKTKHPNNHLFSLGILSFLYFIVTLAAMFVYPIFNGWIYSLWMFITIIAWLVLSCIICVILAKLIYNARTFETIPLDVDGIPLINVHSSFTHSELEDEFAEIKKQELVQEEKEVKEKAKKTKTKAKKEPKTKTAKTKKTASVQTTKKKNNNKGDKE